MAIVSMSRVEILALRKDQERLLHQLQQLGCVEVEEVSADVLPEAFELQENTMDSKNKQLEKIRWAIGVLGRYNSQKAPLFGGKPEISREEIEKIYLQQETLMEVVAALEECESTRGEIKGKLARLEVEKEQLLPWESLPVDPIVIQDSYSTYQLLGTLPNDQFLPFEQHWEGQPVHIERLHISG
ncbi:MAG: hypothetical protein GX786_05700, partial [Clostridiales bacterium]|nr:hypothetical protein [Clostridiales bacterium]